jgi:hypothetical protein
MDTIKPATPLPWKQSAWVTSGITDEHVYCNIGNTQRACSVSVHGRRFKDGKVTSVRLPELDANADATYLVAACNAYPHLTARVKQLEEALEKIARPEIAWNHVDGLQLIARAALAALATRT